MSVKADASPTKEFFVNMITRDISLQDCILDLLDNSVDGARRSAAAGLPDEKLKYTGFRAEIEFAKDHFRICDNCGGISVELAQKYAFRFGKTAAAPRDGAFSIGLYGIGMKRAVLKLGKSITIKSSTAEESFTCEIDVDDWLSPERGDEWDFTLGLEATNAEMHPATEIVVRNLYSGIAEEFADQTFQNAIRRMIARDYAIILGKGFTVVVGGAPIIGHRYEVRQSADFVPFRKTYDDSEVKVTILAGMAALPSDSAEPGEAKVSEAEFYGWFIVCNDRVVLAADKSPRTVWGDEGFSTWHPQYNGFIGMVLFNSEDPRLLPWTTTKTDVDESLPLYRRAVVEMKKATQPWLSYTTQRRSDLEAAHIKELAAQSVPLLQLGNNTEMRVPKVSTVQVVTVQYHRPLTEVKRVAKALGNVNMAYRTVGIKTFDYYLKNEVEE